MMIDTLDSGLLGDPLSSPIGKRRPAQPRGGPCVYLPALPHTDWSPPLELPSLRGVKRLGFDTETRDPDLKALGPGVRRDGYVVGMSLATEDGRKWYLPMRHASGDNLDPDLIWRWARSELNAYDGELVGTQLVYDLDYMAEQGVTFPKVTAFHDVQVAEPLIDEWRFKYALDALAQDYLGEGKDEALLRQVAKHWGWEGDEVKANLWQLPPAYVGPYAEADADLPLRILPLQLAKLEAENLLPVYTIERKLIPLLLRMRRRGVRIDMEAAPRVRAELAAERDRILAKLKYLAGPQAEFMAPDSFVKALDERGLQYPLTKTTKKPSITKDWLKANIGDELCATVIEGRKINTVVNVFMDGHILTHAINGRIHCTFTQLKGDDGGAIARFASQDPNLQNLPEKEHRMCELVRGLFLPDEGCEWQLDDYSQIEYRFLAHYAVGKGAAECRRKYNTDPKTNYHHLCAEFCGIDPNDKLLHSRVKNINFAKGYGAAVPRLAALMGCSLEDADSFTKRYETALPFTVETYNTAMMWAKRRGFIVTILGRKQRFPFYEPVNNYGENKLPALPRGQALEAYGDRICRANCYTAMNRKMQGSAADMMKKAMVDADEAGVFADDALGAPHLTVHDELDSSVPPTARGYEAGQELARIMVNAITLRVPVTVDSKRGANWGLCKTG